VSRRTVTGSRQDQTIISTEKKIQIFFKYAVYVITTTYLDIYFSIRHYYYYFIVNFTHRLKSYEKVMIIDLYLVMNGMLLHFTAFRKVNNKNFNKLMTNQKWVLFCNFLGAGAVFLE